MSALGYYYLAASSEGTALTLHLGVEIMKWHPLPDHFGFQAEVEPFETQSSHPEAFEGSLLKTGVAAEDLGSQATPQDARGKYATQVFQVCQQGEPVFCQASP